MFSYGTSCPLKKNKIEKYISSEHGIERNHFSFLKVKLKRYSD